MRNLNTIAGSVAIALLLLFFLSSIAAADHSDPNCIIPTSGAWPQCAKDGHGVMESSSNGANSADCVIPESGPWPACATAGGGASTTNTNSGDCVIPASGPWPSCATGATGAGNGTASNSGNCIIPTSGPWPPCATSSSNTSSPAPASSEQGRVTRIIDGDTVVVDISGSLYTVRLIGIDAPERDEICAFESTQALSNKLNGQWVRLERDVSEVDRFDRLLRYIYINDRFINSEMVRDGLAVTLDYYPDTKFSSLLAEQQTNAQNAQRGCLWNPAQPPPSNCHPSYPDVCIPPAPPDLNCADISHQNFRVIGVDPHGFDGDNDGVGCENN